MDNISQTLELGHDSVYVITNARFFERFRDFPQVRLVAMENLQDPFHYEHLSKYRGDPFRGGFWLLCSLRFFYIYAWMRRDGVDNVLHLENDTMIYWHTAEMQEQVDAEHIFLPFDTWTRNIASIMYIPNADLLGRVLENYDAHKSDMENFSVIRKATGLIDVLPVFITPYSANEEEAFVCRNFYRYVYDGAAIGQYVGGVDPANIPGDTRGFVNETCIIKFDQHRIEWDEMGRPILVVDGLKYPVFNLHLHCKNLRLYRMKSLSSSA